MKTGTDRVCARFNGPPRTALAAITTRFPVTWAVKIIPSVKKPVRSTIPAITLSRGGSRASNRASVNASSDGWREGWIASLVVASHTTAMFGFGAVVYPVALRIRIDLDRRAAGLV